MSRTFSSTEILKALDGRRATPVLILLLAGFVVASAQASPFYEKGAMRVELAVASGCLGASALDPSYVSTYGLLGDAADAAVKPLAPELLGEAGQPPEALLQLECNPGTSFQIEIQGTPTQRTGIQAMAGTSQASLMLIAENPAPASMRAPQSRLYLKSGNTAESQRYQILQFENSAAKPRLVTVVL